MQKTTRTLSPFRQAISKTSEHQRRLLWKVMTVPSCVRCGPAVDRTSSKPFLLHDPVDSLAVDPGLSFRGQPAVEHPGTHRVAERRPLVHDRPDQREQRVVLGLPVWAALFPLGAVQVRSRYVERVADGFHREPSLLDKGMRESSFFSRAIRWLPEGSRPPSSFCPVSRSSSRMRVLSCLASDAGTTALGGDGDETAFAHQSAPSEQLIGIDTVFAAYGRDGGSGLVASSRMAHFSSAFHRRRRGTDVITSTAPKPGGPSG